MARAKQRFLRIQRVFHVYTVLPLNSIMRPRIGSQHAFAKKRAHSIGIVKREVERVIYQAAFALAANVAKNGFGRAKQLQRLVNQMRRKIKIYSAAAPGI